MEPRPRLDRPIHGRRGHEGLPRVALLIREIGGIIFLQQGKGNMSPYLFYLISGVALIGLYLWARIAIKYRSHWLITIGPITYFLHVLAFNIVVHFWTINSYDIVLWSNAVRLHSMFLIIALATLLLARYRRKFPPL